MTWRTSSRCSGAASSSPSRRWARGSLPWRCRPVRTLVLLTDHVEGEAPILVYRVTDLRETLASMRSRGWEEEVTFEIPHGPCCSFRTPGGQRFAVYQLTRPEAARHFDGRRDF